MLFFSISLWEGDHDGQIFNQLALYITATNCIRVLKSFNWHDLPVME